MSEDTEIAREMALYQEYKERRKRDQERYTAWVSGSCAGEPPQMVIQMYQSWMTESHDMVFAGIAEPTFRGIPMRWLRQASRDANTKAGEQ